MGFLLMEVFKTLGAIAWPSQRARRDGWVLTLDLLMDESNTEKVEFRIKDCASSSDVLVLIGWGKNKPGVDWYSDIVDKRAMTIMAYHHFVLPISPAPYIEAPDAIPLYLQILHQCLGAGKILFFGESGIGKEVSNQIIDIRQDKASKVQDYPAVAAVSYAVSAAYLWYKAPEKEIIPTHAEHIIASVQGRKEYEPYAQKYLDVEGEVYGDSNCGDVW
jgi:hypothetical protein